MPLDLIIYNHINKDGVQVYQISYSYITLLHSTIGLVSQFSCSFNNDWYVVTTYIDK